MKVKITRPDGTIIEAEGTIEECEKLIGAPVQNPLQVQNPIYPIFWFQQPYPVYPSYPSVPYYGDPYPWTPGIVISGPNTTGLTFTVTEPAPLRM